MKRDVNYGSVCRPGEEYFKDWNLRDYSGLKYEFRDPSDLALFSGVFLTLEAARESRDRWLRDRKPIQ